MKTQTKLNLLNISMIFLIMVVLSGVFMIILDSFNNQYKSVFETVCENQGGTVVFYECYHSVISPQCEKEGNYCRLPNGTETDLSDKINVLSSLK